MRVAVRKIIDSNVDVNSNILTPYEKIKVAIQTTIAESKLLHNRILLEENRKRLTKYNRIETVKNQILALIIRELEKSESLKRTTSLESIRAESIIISVSAEYEDILFPDNSMNNVYYNQPLIPLFQNKEFEIYDIKQINENPDIRISFPKMPYKFICTRKIL